jgi:hypothetical protein
LLASGFNLLSQPLPLRRKLLPLLLDVGRGDARYIERDTQAHKLIVKLLIELGVGKD